MPVGACVESCTSSAPSSSKRATTARPSSGVAALRSISNRHSNTCVASAMRGVDVAVLLGDAGDDVVRAVAVHERRVRRRGASMSATTGSGSYLHDDRARRVLGDVAVARDDHRDRLADVADLVARERVLRAPVGDRLVRDDQRQRLGERARRGPRRCRPRRRRRRRARRRRRCRRSARARSRSARTRRARRAARSRRCSGPWPTQQPVVLPPLHPLAEHSRRHSRTLAERSVTTGSQPE